MKNNTVAAVLVVVLALEVASAGVMAIFYNRHASRARQLQGRLADIQNTQTILQALANDASAYAQRNPSIVPVLQNFGLTGGPSSLAPAGAPVPVATPTIKDGTPKNR